MDIFVHIAQRNINKVNKRKAHCDFSLSNSNDFFYQNGYKFPNSCVLRSSERQSFRLLSVCFKSTPDNQHI